jgi:hypothetical protein
VQQRRRPVHYTTSAAQLRCSAVPWPSQARAQRIRFTRASAQLALPHRLCAHCFGPPGAPTTQAPTKSAAAQFSEPAAANPSWATAPQAAALATVAASPHISAETRQAMASSAARVRQAGTAGPATAQHLDAILAACRSRGVDRRSLQVGILDPAASHSTAAALTQL